MATKFDLDALQTELESCGASLSIGRCTTALDIRGPFLWIVVFEDGEVQFGYSTFCVSKEAPWRMLRIIDKHLHPEPNPEV